MALDIVQGQTAPIYYQLLADGVAYPLTGCTVTVVALLASGTTVTWTGVLTVTSETLGKVKFVPASTDFSADHSKYLVRFRVVRADAGIEYFPNGSAEVWTVRR